MTDALTRLMKQLKMACDKASTGPWTHEVSDEFSGRNWLLGTSYGDDYSKPHLVRVTTKDVHASEYDGDAATDAEFIVLARTALPALVRMVEVVQVWSAKPGMCCCESRFPQCEHCAGQEFRRKLNAIATEVVGEKGDGGE